MDTEAVSRLRKQLLEDEREESAVGHAAGLAWAKKLATATDLSNIESLRGRAVSGVDFLAMVITKRRKANDPPRPYSQIFGEFLDMNRGYTKDFLRGFVAGALEVWDAVKQHLE